MLAQGCHSCSERVRLCRYFAGWVEGIRDCTPSTPLLLPIGHFMSACISLGNSIVSQCVLSFVHNFWHAPRLGLASRRVWEAARSEIRLFHAAYLQGIEHLCEQDQRRRDSLAITRYQDEGLIF